MKEQLRRPLPWAALSAATLTVALALPPSASSLLFWGLVGACCATAATAGWLLEPDD